MAPARTLFRTFHDPETFKYWRTPDGTMGGLTVLSGTFNMGTGDSFDRSKTQALNAGGFAVMPTQTRHFAWTATETVIQVHGVGPWGLTYVNPTDDPRAK